MIKTELLEVLNDLEEVANKCLKETPNTLKHSYYAGYYAGVLETVKTIKKAVGYD